MYNPFQNRVYVAQSGTSRIRVVLGKRSNRTTKVDQNPRVYHTRQPFLRVQQQLRDDLIRQLISNGRLSAEQSVLLSAVETDETSDSSSNDIIESILQQNSALQNQVDQLSSRCIVLEEDLNVKEVMRLDEKGELEQRIEELEATVAASHVYELEVNDVSSPASLCKRIFCCCCL